MTRTIDSTPRADGYRMPGEFEPHAGTWMLWPQRPDNWRLGGKPAQRAFVAVADAISRFEPLTMGVNHDQFENARNLLPPRVRVVEISSNDAWMRDIGPSFVVDDKGGVRAVDWVFNAWGGLYDGLYFPWDKDDLVPQKVCEILSVDRYRAPFVLEGGSIHVDGEGTVITTEECLLSPGRNPGLSREQIEEGLRDYLGVEKVVWLGRGFDPEETTGHVDDVACYVRPGVVASPGRTTRRTGATRSCATTSSVSRGRPTPAGVASRSPGCPARPIVTITEDDAWGVDAVEGTLPRRPGDRMPATYVNFYICNGGVVMPVFDDPEDETARETMQRLFPGARS